MLSITHRPGHMQLILSSAAGVQCGETSCRTCQALVAESCIPCAAAATPTALVLPPAAPTPARAPPAWSPAPAAHVRTLSAREVSMCPSSDRHVSLFRSQQCCGPVSCLRCACSTAVLYGLLCAHMRDQGSCLPCKTMSRTHTLPLGWCSTSHGLACTKQPAI